MRRKDVLFIICLLGVAFLAWQKLQPPKIEANEQTVDEAFLTGLSKWHGALPQASIDNSANANGEVKGASTETGLPESLLPVESYSIPPFTYDLKSALESQNITVYPEDALEIFPSLTIGLGSTLKVYRATPVEVTDWGKKQLYRTWAKTTTDFLTEAKIEIGENDRIEPGLSSNIKIGDDNIAHYLITRVEITQVKEPSKIDFKKIQKEDDNLPRGQTKVTKGKIGRRIKTWQVRRENGQEVSRKLLKDEVIEQPSDEVTIVGTKVVIGKSFTGKASWYKYNSTKVASDNFKRGTNLRITNLDNGKVIFVRNDGCICADTGFVVDLHPDYFTALGGRITDGVIKNVKVDEVLN